MAAKAKRRKGTDPAGPSTRSRTGRATAFKRKSCALCARHVQEVDYKNVDQLRRFISDRGRIRSRPMTGACRRHQRQVAVAIKRAREMALLPYVGPNDVPPSRSNSAGRR